MSKRVDAAYLQDIVDAGEYIEVYLAGVGFDGFCQRQLIQDGVTFRLEIIGEACRGLTKAFREMHPEAAWDEMIGMRNRLIHGYFDVNSRVVYDTATIDVPQLLDLVRLWLRETRGEN